MTESATQEIDHGGPAFPADGGSDSGLHPNPGMSLRDYFAGQVLVAMADRGETPQSIADDCYELADAMLKARGEQP